MPGSHPQQINEIVEIMLLLKPLSILDVGVGFGKYAVLAREQLDLWAGAGKGKSEYGRWQCRIDGIEAYEGYLTPLHSFVYDKIFIGNACAVVPTLTRRYDLALLIDVIEHLEPEVGLQLLRDLLRFSRNVLVSTPKKVGAQGPLYENEFERHVSQWRETDFSVFPQRVFLPNRASLICFLGEDDDKVKLLLQAKKRQQVKDSLATLLPFLVSPYRRLKAMFSRL